MSRIDRISVLGAGSWGTALATLLCTNAEEVPIWGRNPEAMAQMATERINRRYLPGITLPGNLSPVQDLAAAVNPALRFLLVVPSESFGQTLGRLKSAVVEAGHDPSNATILWGTKGFDPGTLDLLDALVDREFGPTRCKGVITGPSFAGETARNMPTALTLASAPAGSARPMVEWFRTPATRIYFSDDLSGAQVGGAVKNVIAIAAGISDGLGFGANARAALITRGLSELMRLGHCLGARAETLMGLSGMGDLVLTCTDDQSRNRRLGLGLGQGRSLDAVLADIGQEVEGVVTARTVYRLARQHQLEMPITEQVYRIVHEALDPETAVRNLLDRQVKSESPGT